MQKSSSQTVFLSVDRPVRQQSDLAKSKLMSVILGGDQDSLPYTQPNSHYIDSLERFKRDFALYDKQQRQRERQKRLRILEEKKNQQLQRESRIRRNQIQYDERNQEKINQSRYLCEIGLKKTGFSNGMPLNPITLQYHQNPFGHQQKFNDQEQKLRRLVRAHHIQNASTSGFNPINGQYLPSIEPLIPKNSEGRLQKKLGEFYETRRLDPNVDLQLNPKNMLPRYVGEIDRTNNSPIKYQRQSQQVGEFQTAYQSHFNQKPHQMMANSRINELNYYRQMLQEPQKVNDNHTVHKQSYNRKDWRPQYRQNDENLNPYIRGSIDSN